ncbi:hypothetical protein ACIRON_02970 [Nocardioides sp. NPDC101246]|uniref:hypothetical protein n=1 Tax=Nocardioides sp. NPDC101246 TaxID=3364336 RepID=UPI0038246000
MSIRVTVHDTETDDREVMTIENDYVIVTAGTCVVTNTQTYANGTHVLTVKVEGRRS